MENEAGSATPTSSASNSPNRKGKRPNQEIDWTKFGLSDKSNFDVKQRQIRTDGSERPNAEYIYTTTSKENVKELFEEEEVETDQEPWWKSSFFITRTLLFGTWDGVFTSSLINIVGVVIFLRTGWMIAYAGIGLSLLIVFLSVIVAFATVMSAVGICERSDMRYGGVYFIVSHVLGGRLGGTVGLLYCLGHAAATALYCTGFSESLATLIHWKNAWAVRSISLITLLFLLAIAISGVKWVIRFQLVLVGILGVAVVDFVIGSLAHTNPAAGVTGFSTLNFNENMKSMFTENTKFFTVFGVFFPAACGVMAGVNMSGDLRHPDKSIPKGSIAAIGVSCVMYLVFIFILGAVCTRHALKTNYMIIEEVSIVGVLFLLGLYVSSLSSILGGLVGPPRVLQCIGEDDIMPVLRPFAKTRGINKEPQNATFVIAFLAILFILVGRLNTLAPIVTMPFLLTYAAINYSYFSLIMSYDVKQQQQLNLLNETPVRYSNMKLEHPEPIDIKTSTPIHTEKIPLIAETRDYGSNEEVDYQEQIEDSVNFNDNHPLVTREHQELDDKEGYSSTEAAHEAVEDICKTKFADVLATEEKGGSDNGLPKEKKKVARQDSEPVLEFVKEKRPDSLYAKICNRWVSLITCGVCFILMFCINWTYALVNLSVALVLYIGIGHFNPGLSPGVASDFHLFSWLTSPWKKRRRKKAGIDRRIVVQKNCVPFGISMYQITEDNVDYLTRDRKHHSSLVHKPTPYH